MNRSLIIVLGALALGTALFGGSYFISRHVCVACEMPPDNLAWLQKEYDLNNAQMAHIQKLHESYISRCAMMCQTVNAKKQELAAALNDTTNIGPVVEQKLSDLAACRAQCQAKMLQYFIQVSQVMPPTEGRRYLAEMRSFALSLQGESLPSVPGHEQHQP